ncbi:MULTISPECIES: methyltransferase [unclassified Clostridioides]|uniref:methyltransferase n=1 Tax=unclassified Clostridioides TaxID=2635829 RepID=UPI001D12DDB4|nr:methyltransferase domain-containing protein [Clostridioides sp. ES-S-0010-02]UDN61429.1 methyltransferase domain-containing protein [Clostridioides sp. ES-W-0016-02]
MRMNWNDTTIKSFVDASEYTGFHKILAKEVIPYIKDSQTFCDVGCGLGLIDMYLSKELKDITCIDINQNAINYLEKSIKDNNISNIRCMVKDFKDINTKFDTILISFFSYENIEFFTGHCDRLIAIVNDKSKTHIPVSKKRMDVVERHSSKNLKVLLDEKKLRYELIPLSLEFGQTFTCEDDIVRYAKSYDEGGEYETIYNHIMKNIVKGDKVAYYLPYEKNISVFIIDFNR